MRNLLHFIFLLLISTVSAQEGFGKIHSLESMVVSANTGEKPQSKVWSYARKHYAVLPDQSGTWLWRLDGLSWKKTQYLSENKNSKADVKIVGDIAYVLLFKGGKADLITIVYDKLSGVYTNRTRTDNIPLDDKAETATIDIDGDNRMWIAFNGESEDRNGEGNKTFNIYVSYSNPPYDDWSTRQSIANNIKNDDIGAVISLPDKIAVFWSNQNTQRFGFRTHLDGAPPTSWSIDEKPASDFALDRGDGMADDHMNFAVADDGTLFCAVKTSYDNMSKEILLLKRLINGKWDHPYTVSNLGTRPIVLLNEKVGKIRVIYTERDGGGDILYKESSTENTRFEKKHTLMKGKYNNSTSTKNNFTSEVVVLASEVNGANLKVAGVLLSE